MSPSDGVRVELEAERARLALLTRKGIGMPAAGMLFWLATAVVVRVWPQRPALVIMFILTGLVFPVGVFLTRLVGGNLFAKSQALTSLGLLLMLTQLFYWPVVIVVFRQAPEWTPFAMAVLFGSHFLPYAWFYRSVGYALLATSVVVVLSAAAIATRSPLYLAVPVLTSACYAAAIVVLWREVTALVAKSRAGAAFTEPTPT
jgi:hypothetical protein